LLAETEPPAEAAPAVEPTLEDTEGAEDTTTNEKESSDEDPAVKE
jgi:hypothetical protein